MVTPSVELVVVNYKGRDILPKCLNYALRSDYPNYNVTVVDNASTDGSADAVRQAYPQVGLVRLTRNRGYAGGANAGLATSNAEFVIIMNSDVFLDSQCVSALVRVALSDGMVGLVQPKIYRDFSSTLDSAGAYTLFPLGYDHHLGHGDSDIGRFDQSRTLCYAYGACFLMRRKLVFELGDFDEDFFLFHEESDFCWRARSHGYKILSCPQAVTWHLHSYTMLREAVDVSYFMERSRILMLLKNYGMMYLAGWLMVEPVHGVRLIGDKSVASSYLRGWGWNLRNLAKTLVKRMWISRRVLASGSQVLSTHIGFPSFFGVRIAPIGVRAPARTVPSPGSA